MIAQTQPLRCLGIESSCDETAAAVVTGGGEILSNVVFGQAGLHDAYGGVVPEIAARAHAERLDHAVRAALEGAACALSDLDLIAVTSGPGLIGGVMSGVITAKALGAASGVPVLGVNHLAGHVLTPMLSDGLRPPYLVLLVSGGHCQFIAVLSPRRFQRLGGTLDDAPGEAFDKSARLLGLGYPGGPEVEKAAASGEATRFVLPRPLLDREGCDLSFSGLKTAVRRARDRLVAAQGGLYQRDVADLAASFQEAVADVLATKTERALADMGARHPITGLAVAGGVAANGVLRARLRAVAEAHDLALSAPPLELCTDNGAMIAWAGLAQWQDGAEAGQDLSPRPRWPLDDRAAPLLGFGKRGVKA
ncbi:MAG: tRNA (adenosine(37)-N6)-threonylcarbamoyltransferase complex transferase subunit TsaD [Pseudomonadota bacterium]